MNRCPSAQPTMKRCPSAQPTMKRCPSAQPTVSGRFARRLLLLVLATVCFFDLGTAVSLNNGPTMVASGVQSYHSASPASQGARIEGLTRGMFATPNKPKASRVKSTSVESTSVQSTPVQPLDTDSAQKMWKSLEERVKNLGLENVDQTERALKYLFQMKYLTTEDATDDVIKTVSQTAENREKMLIDLKEKVAGLEAFRSTLTPEQKKQGNSIWRHLRGEDNRRKILPGDSGIYSPQPLEFQIKAEHMRKERANNRSTGKKG